MLGDWKPKEIEPKWQTKWVELKAHNFDENDTKKPVYSIDTPPPFTSGKLHMGHLLSYSYFDFSTKKRGNRYRVFTKTGNG